MRVPFFAILFLPFLLHAQPLRQDWQLSINGNATLHAVLEATNGLVIAVGETSTNTNGGTDGLVLIVDHSTGQKVVELRLGGSKDDALYAAVQTHDGRFLLAGSTASSGKGDKDAWLVLLDERGRKIWETTFGTPGRDECREILLLPDGDALLAGYQNGKKNGDVWLAKVAGNKLVWEKNLGASEFETLGGLALASDGGFAFCGNTGKKAGTGAGDIYLAKTDPRGELQWKKWFGEGGWEEALDLVATHDGGFAIAGITKSKGAGDLDCWLLKTSRDGFRQWDKTYGGKGADVANALLQTDDGGFLLVGASKSKRSGMRFDDAFFVQTAPGGDLQWEQYHGNDREDALAAICSLHDGSVAVIGSLDGSTATLWRFSNPQTAHLAAIGIRDAATVEVSDAVVRNADGTLTPGERTYLSFRVTNKSDLDLHDLRASVDNRSANGHLTAWSANYFGLLRKNGSVDVRIPLLAANDLTDGEQRLHITVSTGEKTLRSFEKTVVLRKPKPATLLITEHDFAQSGRSDEVTLTVQIENSGDSVSRPTDVRFICPEGIKPAAATVFQVGTIEAHTRKEIKFPFVKTPQFTAPVAAIACAVQEAGAEKARKTFEWQTGAGKTAILSAGPILIWTDPAPHETGTNKVRRSDNHFEFKMTVVSAKPLDVKLFKIKVNGKETAGSKFNEEDLSPPKRENAQYTYTYRNKIPLQQGKNRVEVVVDGKVSDHLEVEFVPERANLFVLAIGPAHDDLKYTGKDAADFAAAFSNQAGQLFKQVIVNVLNTPEKTDLTGIKQAAFDLAYLWDDKQIKPTDVLLVFVSSHGKIVDNRFKILQTGYNPKYERLAVDFKSDVLEILTPINCKKMVFLDACHSGGAKDGFGGLSQAVVDLAKAQPGISTLTSCGSTEKSYENPTWENGAFTEALLEAFANTECHDADGTFRADANADGVIRLGELYDFLRRRVPALVQTAIPNAPTSQTPFMPENQLDKDMPIYWLGN